MYDRRSSIYIQEILYFLQNFITSTEQSLVVYYQVQNSDFLLRPFRWSDPDLLMVT